MRQAELATFGDPDDNQWMLQRVAQRLPGRVSADTMTFTSQADLAAALRRAAAAHGDASWPDWYAKYIVREQTGQKAA